MTARWACASLADSQGYKAQGMAAVQHGPTPRATICCRIIVFVDKAGAYSQCDYFFIFFVLSI